MEISDSLIYVLVFGTALVGILVTATIGFLILHNKKVITYHKMLLKTNIEAQENERERISKELHDALSSEINYARMSILKIEKVKHEEINKIVQESAEFMRNAMEKTRDISKELTPSGLKRYGLGSALEDLCRRVSKVYKNIYYSDKSGSVRLSDFQEINAFRGVQELLSNAVKHSQANNINISIQKVKGRLEIVVQDDGIGFDIEKKKSQNEGLGLTNIVSRVQLAGGIYKIKSDATNGTQAKISLLLKR